VGILRFIQARQCRRWYSVTPAPSNQPDRHFRIDMSRRQGADGLVPTPACVNRRTRANGPSAWANLVAVATSVAVAGCSLPFVSTPEAAPTPSISASVLVADAFPGVAVKSVRAGSAAARSGLQAGDVVTAVDGRSVNTAQELVKYLGTLPSGRAARLAVTRADGTSAKISITLRVLSG
jgi:PDZ domain